MNKQLVISLTTVIIAMGFVAQGNWSVGAEEFRDIEIVRDPSRPVSKNAMTQIVSEANCPEGKKVVSGGYSIVHGEGSPIHGSDQVRVFQNIPKPDGTGWYVRAWVYSKDAALYYQALAICATVRGRE